MGSPGSGVGSPGSGALRLTRALALATLVVAVSVGAHLLAGGTAPPPLVLVALLAATTGPCWLLTRTPLSLASTLVVMGAGQVALHCALSVLSTPMSTGSTSTAPMPMAEMLAAHVIATIVLTAWFISGERSLWLLWCWSRPLFVIAALAVVALPEHPRPAPAPEPAPARPVVLPSTAWRRGPPVPLFA